MKVEDYIKSFFSYDKDTGVITRLDRKNSNGSFDAYGYLIIKIKGNQYKAHRLAWFLYYGEFPKHNIDHINHNRADNRIINLRDVTQAENNKNNTKVINKDTGVYGVCLDKTKGLKKKYLVSFKGKTYRFYTVNEAINFRNEKFN
jgi:hypothetical protein